MKIDYILVAFLLGLIAGSIFTMFCVLYMKLGNWIFNIAKIEN